VKTTPHFSLPRALGVAVLLAAWLTLSNHCALAVLGHNAGTAQSAELHKCCAGKAPNSEKKAPDSPSGMCCKSLRVLPTDAPAKLVQAQNDVLLFEFIWASLSHAPAASVRGETARAMRPPRAVTFAERVLQQSLLSHAPPLAA